MSTSALTDPKEKRTALLLRGLASQIVLPQRDDTALSRRRVVVGKKDWEGSTSSSPSSLVVTTGSTYTLSDWVLATNPPLGYGTASVSLEEFTRPYVASWLAEAISDLNEQIKEGGNHVAAANTLNFLNMCARFEVGEPAIDVSEEGNVELYFKNGTSALLAVIKRDGILQIFGDFKGDQWRSRFNMSGNVWRSQFELMMRGLEAG